MFRVDEGIDPYGLRKPYAVGQGLAPAETHITQYII